MPKRLYWYKAEPVAFINATFDLPWDVKCVYRFIIDLIYANDGRLPDDDRLNAAKIGCDLRVWKRIKSELLARGKLIVNGRFLHNERCDKQIAAAHGAIAQRAEAGKSSAARRSGEAPAPSLAGSPAGELAPKGAATGSEVVRKSDQALVQGCAKSDQVSRKHNGLASTESQRTLNGYKIEIRGDSESLPKTESQSTNIPPNPVSSAPRKPRRGYVVPEGFEERFWPAYRRKEDRYEASKALAKALKIASLDVIMAGLDRWNVVWTDRGVEVDKLPHPTTWLNKRRWQDMPEVMTRCGTAAGPPKSVANSYYLDALTDPLPKVKVVNGGGGP